MSTRSIAMLVLVVALVALAGGCGGDSTDDGGSGAAPSTYSDVTTAAPPLSRARFIKEADAICAEGLAATRRKAEAMLRRSKPNVLQRVLLTVVLPAVEAKAEAVSALGVPRGDEQEIETMLRGIERGLAVTRANPDYASENGNPFNSVRAAAERYGFQTCWPI